MQGLSRIFFREAVFVTFKITLTDQAGTLKQVEESGALTRQKLIDRLDGLNRFESLHDNIKKRLCDIREAAVETPTTAENIEKFKVLLLVIY